MSPRPESRTRPCNVLIIGTDGAGLRAAIAARQAGVSLVAIGMREHYDVNYLGPVTFALSPLAAEPDLRASGD